MKHMTRDRMQEFHIPVLLNEVVKALNIHPGSWYVDATTGGGGHTKAILDQAGKVIALDADKQTIDYLYKKFHQEIKQGQLILHQGNFIFLDKYLQENQIDKISGIIIDLGLSTYQIKMSGKGFTFQNEEPLDMRLDQNQKLTAEKIINTFSKEELYEIFVRFGEENLAGDVADAICRARTLKPITTTRELRRIVSEVYQRNHIRTKIDPATKVFQALRIAVNDELNNLKIILEKSLTVLNHHGRCVVISFHSLEDRIVKQYFSKMARKGKIKIVNNRPITATDKEISVNPASRSAKMRIAELN